jgi:hypothetical protein
MDPLAELLKIAQDEGKPMRHRMRAAPDSQGSKLLRMLAI